MNVMQRYTLKTLRMNRQRTLVTIIGVIISTAMITAVAVFLASFMNMLQRSVIADTGNWHALLRNVPAANVEQVRTDETVDQVVLKHDVGFAELPGSQNPGKPYLHLRQFDAAGFEQMSVRLAEGRLPQTGDEIVLSETVNRTVDKPFDLGDQLTLTTGRRVDGVGDDLGSSNGLVYRVDPETGEWIVDPETGDPVLDERLLAGETHTYTVVGFIERPGMEPSWSASCVAIGLLEDGASDRVDVYYTAKRVSRAIYADAPVLAEAVGAREPLFHDELLRYHAAVASDSLFAYLAGLSTVIFVIILVASVSMIGNAFGISVSERSRQLGILASVGATPSQKRASVYFEAALIYLAGVPLGLLAGIGGMAVTMELIRPLMQSFVNTSGDVSLDLVVPLSAVLVALVLSAVTLLLSARKPARLASRVQPIDAIRQSGDIRVSAKSVRTGSLVRRLFGFEAEIALKNLRRSRRKYRATIASLVISIVLFLTVSTYADTAGMLFTASDEGINYDIIVSYDMLPADRAQAMPERIEALEGIDAMTTNRIAYVTLAAQGLLTEQAQLATEAYALSADQFTAQILQLDDRSLKVYANMVGIDRASLDGAVPGVILINTASSTVEINGALQKVMGQVLRVRGGEELKLSNGVEDAIKSASVVVAAQTDERPMGVLMPQFSPVVLVTGEAGFEKLVSDLGVGPGMISHQSFLKTPDDIKLENDLRILFLADGSSSHIGISNYTSYARSQRNVSIILGVFVYGFITLISLICIANIFNTVSTNVALRRKEFAMLRSVGMTPSGFNRMIRFESAFYGLKSLLYGIPISIAVAVLLYWMQRSTVETAFTLPWDSYAFAVGLIFVVVFATMLYSSRRFKRENIIEALRQENL